MTAESWPAADERLVRHYRRLLLAYSGGYRRRHGTEMITTMLEMAEPGRSRPSAGEAWHLVASGLRQRFRLPSGLPFAWLAAVLVTLVLGVFGAAAGSWLGQRTFADLPTRAEAEKLGKAMVPDPAYVFSPRMSQAGRADFLSFSVGPRGATSGWTVEAARNRLTATGWTVTEFTIHPRPAKITCATDNGQESCSFETRDAALMAERGGLILRGTATDFLADGSGGSIGGVSATVFAERSAAYLPLTVAGALLGALVGWLLAAALAYRIRSVAPGSGRLAAAFAGVAVTTAVPVAWLIVINAVMLSEHLTYNGPVYTLHSAFRAGSYPFGPPSWMIPGCTLAAAAAGLIAVGILIRGTDRTEAPSAAQST
jgi:hypothetical protein